MQAASKRIRFMRALRVRDYFHGVPGLCVTRLGCISGAFLSRSEVMRDFSPFSVLVDLGDAP